MEPSDVLEFWFATSRSDPAALPARYRVWFGVSGSFDSDVTARFESLIRLAANGAYPDWRNSARGTLALILVFDQFPRNVYRGRADAFEFDDQALALSRSLVATGKDKELGIVERIFAYMPMQHAENGDVQRESVQAYESLCKDATADHREWVDSCLRYAREHKDIIDAFGRFPHRNVILGRTPTGSEIQFLTDGGATFGQSPS
jgi:uncharacterized protein (DUF924 family)